MNEYRLKKIINELETEQEAYLRILSEKKLDSYSVVEYHSDYHKVFKGFMAKLNRLANY